MEGSKKVESICRFSPVIFSLTWRIPARHNFRYYASREWSTFWATRKRSSRFRRKRFRPCDGCLTVRAHVCAHPLLREGAWVEVRRGALKGLEGLLVRIKNQTRLVLSINFALAIGVSGDRRLRCAVPPIVGHIASRAMARRSRAQSLNPRNAAPRRRAAKICSIARGLLLRSLLLKRRSYVAWARRQFILLC